jgi:hypothetical protein
VARAVTVLAASLDVTFVMLALSNKLFSAYNLRVIVVVNVPG